MTYVIHKFRGYTLMEFLVVMSISSILLSLALPVFSSTFKRMQGDTVIYSLAGAYQLARSTAISQRQSVVFCARADAQTCGNDWTRGALVFADPNDNRIQDSDERIVADIAAPPTGSQLKMRAALNKQYLRFMGNGMLENTAGSMVYCPPNGTERDARTMIFTRNGRLRFGYDTNHDGILENAEGQPLGCPL
ncbi:MAG TPA: GspH/FimT family pseudopilin [Pseudomonadales bacterium]|nr:GspH/FimT family pseudopilin [Pseudomonadales bacterium]